MSLTRNGEAPQMRQDGDLREKSASPSGQIESSQDFCEWLRRFFGEIRGRDELTAQEANTIRNTLNAMDARSIDDTKDKFKLHYPKEPKR